MISHIKLTVRVANKIVDILKHCAYKEFYFNKFNKFKYVQT